jgi:glucose dehydrogenase
MRSAVLSILFSALLPAIVCAQSDEDLRNAGGNRGGAMYQGRLFRTTLDGRVIALDMITGKEIWNVKSADAKDGIAMTGAPLVASGVVINGMAGGEFGSRRLLDQGPNLFS